MKHRCAVCWREQPNHEAWLSHAETEHGAVMAEFGFHRCTRDPRDCTGVKHLRLRNEGMPRTGRPLNPTPFKAKDGTTYTPVPLFPGDAA